MSTKQIALSRNVVQTGVCDVSESALVRRLLSSDPFLGLRGQLSDLLRRKSPVVNANVVDIAVEYIFNVVDVGGAQFAPKDCGPFQALWIEPDFASLGVFAD